MNLSPASSTHARIVGLRRALLAAAGMTIARWRAELFLRSSPRTRTGASPYTVEVSAHTQASATAAGLKAIAGASSEFFRPTIPGPPALTGTLGNRPSLGDTLHSVQARRTESLAPRDHARARTDAIAEAEPRALRIVRGVEGASRPSARNH